MKTKKETTKSLTVTEIKCFKTHNCVKTNEEVKEKSTDTINCFLQIL